MKKSLILILSAVLILTSVFCVSCGQDQGEVSDTVSKEKPVKPEPNPPKSIRIGSYNIAHTRFADFDVKTFVDEIVALDLDIIGIQEVDRFAERSNFIDTYSQFAMSGAYPFCEYFKAIDLDGDEAKYGSKGQYGLLILSKYPIKKPEIIKYDCPGIEQRIIAHAVIDVYGKDVDFYNTHLSFEQADVRKNQFTKLSELIKDKQSCIITGDFNIETASEFDAIPLKRVNASEKTFITYPEDKLPLDNIYFTDNFKLLSSNMTESGHSDHNMIYAELEIGE